MTDAFCFGLARHTTLQILQAAGFNKTRSSQVIDILTDVLVRYIALIGDAAQEQASLSGRTQSTALDVAKCLADIGMDADDLKEWLDTEGADLKPMEDVPEARIKSLLQSGIYHDEDEFGVLQYQWLSPEDIRAAEELEEVEEDAEMDGDDAEIDGMMLPFANGNGHHDDAKKLAYAYEFQPPLPGAHIEQVQVKIEAESQRQTNGDRPIVRRRRLINNPYSQAIPFEESQLSQDPASVELLKLVRAKEALVTDSPQRKARQAIQDSFRSAYASLSNEQESAVMLSGDSTKRLRLANAIQPDIYSNDTLSGHIPGDESLVNDLVLQTVPAQLAARIAGTTMSAVIPPATPAMLIPAIPARRMSSAADNMTIIHGAGGPIMSMPSPSSIPTLQHHRKMSIAKSKLPHIKTDAGSRRSSLADTPTTGTPKIKIKLTPKNTPTPTITIKQSIAPINTTPDIVNCVCTTPNLDDGLLMISCDRCEQWFHARCVLGPTATAEQVDRLSSWVCPRDR